MPGNRGQWEPVGGNGRQWRGHLNRGAMSSLGCAVCGKTNREKVLNGSQNFFGVTAFSGGVCQSKIEFEILPMWVCEGISNPIHVKKIDRKSQSKARQGNIMGNCKAKRAQATYIKHQLA